MQEAEVRPQNSGHMVSASWAFDTPVLIRGLGRRKGMTDRALNGQEEADYDQLK
jgi:hypothetical protein